MVVRTVIDTNVWFSSILNPFGFPIRGKVDYLVTRDDDMKFDKTVASFLTEQGISVVSIASFLRIVDTAVR